MTTAIPIKATMPVKEFELDTARISAHFIGGLVNLHTTVDSNEFYEVRATPHCLVYPTKGNTENPWGIHKIGDAIELVINELCDEKAEKHDSLTDLLEETLGINGDATTVSEDRIAAVSKIAGDAINARHTLFDQDINEWDAMHCLMFNSNHHFGDTECESSGPWKVVSLGKAVEHNIMNLCGFPFDSVDGNWHIVYAGTQMKCNRADEIFENSLEEMLGISLEMSSDILRHIKEITDSETDQTP